MSRLLAIPLAGFAFFFCAASVSCWGSVIWPQFPGDRLMAFGLALVMTCIGIGLVIWTVYAAMYGINPKRFKNLGQIL